MLSSSCFRGLPSSFSDVSPISASGGISMGRGPRSTGCSLGQPMRKAANVTNITAVAGGEKLRDAMGEQSRAGGKD